MVWLQQPGSRLWGLSSLPPGRRAETLRSRSTPALTVPLRGSPLTGGAAPGVQDSRPLMVTVQRWSWTDRVLGRTP